MYHLYTKEKFLTHIDDIISGLIIVGENGYGDEFGIGSPESYSIIEIAKMFGSDIEMLPAMGNRMTADVITSKTEALGLLPKHSIKDYINNIIK